MNNTMIENLDEQNVFNSLVRLNNEKNDVLTFLRSVEEIDLYSLFNTKFIDSATSEHILFFENNILLPIQNTRVYKNVSGELENFLLLNYKNEKEYLSKIKKDFNALKDQANKSLDAIYYEIAIAIELARFSENIYVSDIKLSFDSSFSHKNIVSMFTNYFQIEDVKNSFDNNQPLMLDIEKDKKDNGDYIVNLYISTKSLIHNKIMLNNFLKIISIACSGVVKPEDISYDFHYFDNVYINYKGCSLSNIIKTENYDILSNKKIKKINNIFNKASA